MSATTASSVSGLSWWRQLTSYHWFVFLVASAAWFFDCLDQRLFSLARIPALTELMPRATLAEVAAEGKIVTALFLIGWGIGGLVFGALGDRYGRAKMLTVTVLIYSICTGLSYFSQAYWDFAIFRFLTGVGVGGVFGLAVALIAETVPDDARAGALGMLQILSTVGNVSAGLVKAQIDAMEANGTIHAGDGWRWMFLVGALPAGLVFLIRRYLREPDSWLKLKAEGKLPTGSIFSPYRKLLSNSRWRRNLIVGATLASTGVVGLWGIGEYSPDIQRTVFSQHFTTLGFSVVEVKHKVANAITYAYMLQMLGAAVGMWLFTRAAIRLGRRTAFAIGFSLCLLITAGVFLKMNSPNDAYWMMPLMGATQFAVFAGFAIYLPELFPGSLRSTGTSFCYNLGRFAAAAGSLFSAKLASGVFGSYGSPLQERYAAITMCLIFLAGIAVLPFAPETKDQALPEE